MPKTFTVKSFAQAAAILAAEQRRAENAADVAAAANLRRTSHLRQRGTGRGPAIARVTS